MGERKGEISKSSTSARPRGVSVLTRLKLKRGRGKTEYICVIGAVGFELWGL